MPSSSGQISAERVLWARDGCQVSLAQLDDGSRVILRRITITDGPTASERIEALDQVRRTGLAGFVPLREMEVTQDGLQLQEAFIEGFSMRAALDPVQQHVTVNVALSLICDVARSLAALHRLTASDGTSPLVHGTLSLDELIISRRGEVCIAGLQGLTGSVEDDVEALMAVMRELLATRAVNSKGSALLDRLSELKFVSCGELCRAIETYLQRQNPEQLAKKRQRFTSAVLAVHQDPMMDQPFDDEEATLGEFVDAGDEGQVLRGGGESLAVGIAIPGYAPREDSIPSLDASELELVDPSLVEEIAIVPDHLIDGDTAETAAEMMPEGFLEHILSAEILIEADAGFADGRPKSSPPALPEADPTEDGDALLGATDPVDVDARQGLLGRAAAQDPSQEPPPARGESGDAVRVGDYRVVASIGRGGMGEIYLGREVKDGVVGGLVALKVMSTQGNLLEGNEKALDMLLDEAKIMAHIKHPNVLQVINFGKSSGRYFLATEYLEGRPLVRVMIEAYAKQAGMDYGVVAAIGAGAAHGLHAAHSALDSLGAPLEVVHRDVSPQNIFITYDGTTKVIDFGVARATERITKTAVGLVKGKAAYMSPEQAEGRQVDPRSDVFSLGVCLWEMTAGCRLFKRDQEYDTLVAVQEAPVDPPSVVRGDPNPILDHIILNALERDLSRRTQTARELADQLEDYTRGVGLASLEAPVSELLEGLFGEAKRKEQKLIRELEVRAATPDEVAQLEKLSGVSTHTNDFRQITLVGAPDSLAELDDFGGGARVIAAVDRLQAQREESDIDFDIDEPDFVSADPADSVELESASEEFDIMPTAQLPEALVSQMRAELDVPGPVGSEVSCDLAMASVPFEEDDAAFEAVPAGPPPAIAPASVPVAQAGPKKTSKLVIGLLAAVFLALGIAGILVWQMLSAQQERGPTVTLRTVAATTATVTASVAQEFSPHAGAAAPQNPGLAPEPEVAETDAAVGPESEPASPEPTSPEPVAESEPEAVPEPPAEVAPDPVVATPEFAKPDVVEAVAVVAPVSEPAKVADTTPDKPAASPDKPSALKLMLVDLKAQGLEVNRTGKTYLVDDGRGGSVVVGVRASIRTVRAAGAKGYLVRAKASALTSVGWVGQVGGGPWLARGVSVNDCRARVSASDGGLAIRYGGEEVRLPAGGGVLYDVAVAVPEQAERLEVDPLGISLGKKKRGASAVHCRSGWWGKQVVLRRLPPGIYTLRWTGPGVSQTSTLVVAESGIKSGVLKRVRRPQ